MPSWLPPQLHPVHQHFEAEVRKKRQCKHCSFCQSSNVSRLRAHLLAAHPHLMSKASKAEVVSEEEHSAGDASPEPISKKRRAAEDYRVHQAKRQQLHQYLDRKLTASQQCSIEEAQAYMSVMCLISHNSMDQPAFHTFLRKLCSTYIPPSRFRIGMMIEQITKKVRHEVLEALASQPWVNVAVDGWETSSVA